MILSSTKHYHNHTTTTSSTATPLSPSGVISVCQAVSTDPRVYVAADCAVLEQRSCHSDTQRNGDMRPDHAQRQRHRRSRRAPPVLRQVLMHRHRHHSTRTRVASSSAAPPPLTSFHGDCKWLRQVLPGYSRVRVINNAVHGAHPQSQ